MSETEKSAAARRAAFYGVEPDSASVDEEAPEVRDDGSPEPEEESPEPSSERRKLFTWPPVDRDEPDNGDTWEDEGGAHDPQEGSPE